MHVCLFLPLLRFLAETMCKAFTFWIHINTTWERREHEAISHKTISGSGETSTTFKWFLLSHIQYTHTCINGLSSLHAEWIKLMSIFTHTYTLVLRLLVWFRLFVYFYLSACFRVSSFEMLSASSSMIKFLSIAYLLTTPENVLISEPNRTNQKSNWTDRKCLDWQQ